MERFTEEDMAEMVLRLAHGIRNPLATIKTGIQLVEHLTQPTGDTAQYLTSALNQVERIDMIVKDMQRFVRMENQTFQVLEIGAAVESAKSDCMRMSQEAGVSVTIKKGPELFVFVDGGQLSLAIRELLANAIEFSSQNPSVVMSWEHLSSGSICIHVDDGCKGISDDDREKMKRPFYSSSTQGTGLGLNIVAKFCSHCGGSLDWKNREAGGCRFTLTLPEFENAALSDH